MRHLFHFVLIIATLCMLLAGCQAAPEVFEPECISLLGQPLSPMPLADEDRAAREANLADARTAYEADPTSEDAIIWFGRRTAYLGRYREAIDIFTRGLGVHPASYKLLRHRGHRWITLREFDRAIADLSRAAELIEGVPDEVEPDGMPNRLNIPTSTSHTNIFYHLGLAHYLKREYLEAADAYAACLRLAKNDDMRCAAAYWLYLSWRRAGHSRNAESVLAPIHARMEVIENTSYHRLLLLYKGTLRAEELTGDEGRSTDPAIDDAALGYGLGMWHLLSGDRDRALEVFESVVSGAGWPAFGHIAAEAELARQKEGTIGY